MNARRIGGGEERYVLVFERGDEAMEGLRTFAREHRLSAAGFTGIGAFSEATLGFFDRELRDYRRIAVREQVEVLTLAGDVTLADGRPQVHAHVVVGKADGSAWGGHLLEAYVWPTLEVVLAESPAELRRRHDDETGLPLIAVDER